VSWARTMSGEPVIRKLRAKSANLCDSVDFILSILFFFFLIYVFASGIFFIKGKRVSY
jgi:hypothetical protein